MKKSIALVASLATLLLALGSTNALAAKDKEVTITGEAKCAKCMLKESKTCQTVIQTTGKNGKTTTYYVLDNDVSKGFHSDVCHAAKKVTATGTVKKEGKKREIVLSKIEPAKEDSKAPAK